MGGRCPGRGEICGKFELWFGLIRGSSFSRAARHRDRTLKKMRTCNSWQHCLASQGAHGKPRGVRRSPNWEIYPLQQPFLIWVNTAPELRAPSPTHFYKVPTSVPWQPQSMCSRAGRCPYFNRTNQPRPSRACLCRYNSMVRQDLWSPAAVELAVNANDPPVYSASEARIRVLLKFLEYVPRID